MLPKIATKKQRKLFEFAMKHPYSIVAADPRLGKSMVGIAIQQTLKNNCLIICPGYLTLNWPKEIRKWAKKDVQITVFKKGSEIYEPCDSDFVIISFDLVKKAEHLFEWADMVLIDEAHNLKSMPAKRTEFIHRCIFENSIKRVHPMSGTILKNRVREFYSQISMMYYDPRIEKQTIKPDFLDKFPDEITFADYFSYRKEFKVKITDKRGRTYKMPVAKWEGLKKVDELKSYLKGRYIRVKASEKDLPPVIFKNILISDSPDKALLAAFNAYFEGEGSGSVRPDIKVQAALKKVPFTIKYVEDLLENVKCVLVYSDHRPSIEAIAKHFNVPAITGKMTGVKRSKLAKSFQSGKGNILCATIGSLKEGEDLFRAKDIVLNDESWVPSDLKQVINRIRKLGAKKTRTVHRIFGSPQDEKISEAIQKKIEVIDAAT